jgi:hypothetical protein
MSESESKPVTVADLLARGVPWPLAREAISSTALDRDDEMRTIVVDELRDLGYVIEPPP